MQRSVVRLPRDVVEPFEVYLNGVRQEEGRDFAVKGRVLVFPRALRKDRVSGWRWLVGAFGFATYRQDDSVDVRYVRADGSAGVAQRLEIKPLDGTAAA